jgi:hypothetical protein
MKYEISLQVTTTPLDHFVAERSHGYRLRVVANVVNGFRDPGVFVLQKMSAQESQFSNVASVPQMVDLAVGTPDPQTGFFRSAVLDLVVHEPLTGSELVDELATEVRRLCHEMSRTDGNHVTQTSTTIVVSSDDPLS